MKYNLLNIYYFTIVYFIFLSSCNSYAPYIKGNYVSNNNQQYTFLKSRLQNDYLMVEGDSLLVIYQEEYNDQDNKFTYTIHFVDNGNLLVSDGTSSPVNVHYGRNYLKIPINHIKNFYGLHLVTVVNEKNEKQYIKVQIPKAKSNQPNLTPVSQPVQQPSVGVTIKSL